MKRTRFAWFPIALWRFVNINGSFIERSGRKMWLRKVVEVKTAYNGWTAYEDMQP